jgi:hypothetical protein
MGTCTGFAAFVDAEIDFQDRRARVLRERCE